MDTNITMSKLQRILTDMGWVGKILHVQRESDGVYWIVYTTNVNYNAPNDYETRKFLEADERDILAADMEEAVEFIVHPINFNE